MEKYISKNPCKWMILFDDQKKPNRRVEIYANEEELFFKVPSDIIPNKMNTFSGGNSEIKELERWINKKDILNLKISEINFCKSGEVFTVSYKSDLTNQNQTVFCNEEDLKAVKKFLCSIKD